ncbi:unnamed protein product, partial [Polarella glacialis]
MTEIVNTAKSLNWQIWEINQLMGDPDWWIERVANEVTPDLPGYREWFRERIGYGGTQRSWPRFLPALTALGATNTRHHELDDSDGFHRGQVLLRLLKDLHKSSERVNLPGRPGRPGLTYVEIGVCHGHLSAWLAKLAGPLLGTVYMVDIFDPKFCSPVEDVAKLMADQLNLRPCAREKGTAITLCGDGSFK